MNIYPFDALLIDLLTLCIQFVEKAPEDVVRGVREKATEEEEKLTLTRKRLAFLESTVLVSK